MLPQLVFLLESCHSVNAYFQRQDESEMRNVLGDLASYNSVMVKISPDKPQGIKQKGSIKVYGRPLFSPLLSKLESVFLDLFLMQNFS